MKVRLPERIDVWAPAIAPAGWSRAAVPAEMERELRAYYFLDQSLVVVSLERKSHRVWLNVSVSRPDGGEPTEAMLLRAIATFVTPRRQESKRLSNINVRKLPGNPVVSLLYRICGGK